MHASIARSTPNTGPYDYIGHAWILRDTAAMLGEAGYGADALSPQVMTRLEILHTLAELQQRHPVSSG